MNRYYYNVEKIDNEVWCELIDRNENYSLGKCKEGWFVNQVKNLLNEQDYQINLLNKEPFIRIKNLDDLERFKNILEISLMLINNSIKNKDIDLANESIIHLSRRLRNFNNKKGWFDED